MPDYSGPTLPNSPGNRSSACALKIFSPNKEARIWTGGKDQEIGIAIDVTNADTQELETVKTVALGTFREMLETLTGTGREELFVLFKDMVFDRSDEIQEIARKYHWQHPPSQTGGKPK